jgi:hypothetical protein
MTSFGVMRPRLIAKMLIRAVVPSAIVALISSSEVCAPPAICAQRGPLVEASLAM